MITPVHFREGQFVEVVAEPADEAGAGEICLWEAQSGRPFLIDVGDSVWTRLTL